MNQQSTDSSRPMKNILKSSRYDKESSLTNNNSLFNSNNNINRDNNPANSNNNIVNNFNSYNKEKSNAKIIFKPSSNNDSIIVPKLKLSDNLTINHLESQMKRISNDLTY